VSTAPALSVVIAAHNARGVIEPCLHALHDQPGSESVEVIVADGSDDGTADLVAERFPRVRLLRLDPAFNVPELRGRAIAQARAPVIAVLDPFSIAAPDWIAQTLDAHRRMPNAVIGGAVEMHDAAHAGFAAWTLYFNEYGMFMPPLVQGPATIVPGSNVSYKRAALFDGAQPRYPVFWKTFANWDAESAGSALWLQPAVQVALNKPIPLGDYLRTRFDHGRCFAAMRVEQSGWLVRTLRAMSVPVVPLVLCARWSRVILRKPRHRALYLATLPMQLVLFGVWSAGEGVGYLFGRGLSCRRLFY
jgi:hypothetical protein